jgi:hypothetical protein
MKVPKALKFLAESLEVFDGGESVVYFLIRNEAVVYVGTTQNLGVRINDHRRDKVFDSVLFVRPKAGESARAVESAMIRTIKPRLNKFIPPAYYAGVALRGAEPVVEKSLRRSAPNDKSLGVSNA